PQALRKAGREAEGRGPADVVAEEAGQLLPELGIAPRFSVCVFQLPERLHESLRHVPAAVGTEVARCVRPHAQVRRLLDRAHRYLLPAGIPAAASRTASTKALTRPASLRPGKPSTPLDTSTASGRTMRIASATFSG